jgi:hypothetical protein
VAPDRAALPRRRDPTWGARLPAIDTPPDWADDAFCYVTTTGRRTGRPHTIEIWFVWWDGRVWLLTEGTSDTVANLRADPACRLRVGERHWVAQGTPVDDLAADAEPRRILAAKYQASYGQQPLDGWAAGAVAVAITPGETAGAGG